MSKPSRGSRKHGRKKEKPAFKKWKSLNAAGNGPCAERKVRNLMRQNGMTRPEAVAFRQRQQSEPAP